MAGDDTDPWETGSYHKLHRKVSKSLYNYKNQFFLKFFFLSSNLVPVPYKVSGGVDYAHLFTSPLIGSGT